MFKVMFKGVRVQEQCGKVEETFVASVWRRNGIKKGSLTHSASKTTNCWQKEHCLHVILPKIDLKLIGHDPR